MSTTYVEVIVDEGDYQGVRAGNRQDTRLPYVRLGNVTLIGDKADLILLLKAGLTRLDS